MSSIVTFYSYKGGVGRSMALANIAVLLAQEEQRVLVVDWDLEAPGLEKYFHYFPVSPSGSGLLSMLTDASSGLRESYREYAWIIDVGSNAPITFLSSGREQDPVGYARQLESFDWTRFFNNGGGDYLEELRWNWKNDFDIVLIDSRTGLSDTGGICTIQLPDVVVVMFTANNQSFLGARDVMRHVRLARQKLAYPRMELTVLPVPARIGSVSELREWQTWLERFSEEFSEFYEDWLPSWAQPREVLQKVKIPQIDFFSFGEKLPVVEQGISDPSGMGYAYDQIARVLKNDFRTAHEDLGLRERISKKPKAVSRVEPDDYKWHLYVSYTRLSYIEGWLDDFLTRLKDELSLRLDDEPKIFVDRQEVTLGTSFPQETREGLLRSQLLMPILTTAYFNSALAAAEWRAFEARESITGASLIFPVLIQGSLERYPATIRNMQVVDAKQFNTGSVMPRPGSPRSNEFQEFVEDVADVIVHRLHEVPPFRPDFPIFDPATTLREKDTRSAGR